MDPRRAGDHLTGCQRAELETASPLLGSLAPTAGGSNWITQERFGSLHSGRQRETRGAQGKFLTAMGLA